MAPASGPQKEPVMADTPAEKPAAKRVAKPKAAAKPAAKPVAKAATKAKPAAKPKAATPKPKAAPKPRAAKAVDTVPAVATRFNRALDDARTSATALGKKAQERAAAYRERNAELVDEAKALAEQAKARATELAKDGKARASDALTGIGKLVAENAASVDQHLGARYGDYARSAARSLQEAAVKLEEKDLGELGEDAKQLAKKNPGVALGLAAVVGFIMAQLFSFAND
jgi:outer membrane biosynthesis protein TonB